MGLINYLFNSDGRKSLKKLDKTAYRVEALEPKYAAMTDAQLREQTDVLKGRLAAGETTDDILCDAFALVREAAWRVLGLKHYHVQIIGGIALYQGRIAEMKTGEGKTLVATLPAYLNALTGKGVHIVTVNDYLAKRALPRSDRRRGRARHGRRPEARRIPLRHHLRDQQRAGL